MQGTQQPQRVAGMRMHVAGVQACAALEVDIITFDMARRLPFRLRPGPLQAAVKRGLHLEICYAAALRDETSRRNFFSNASGAVPPAWHSLGPFNLHCK